MNKLEFRNFELSAVETEDSKMIIEGVVNNINEYSKVIAKKFKEKVEPQVFTRAIERAIENNRDIFLLGLHNHKDLPLASLLSKTMELREEDGKLKMRAELPKTTKARDMFELVKSRVLRDFSFGFGNAKATWKKGADGIQQRSISEMDLYEISIVKTGAYHNTEIQARSLEFEDIIPDELKKELEKEKEPEERDLDIELMELRHKRRKKRMKTEE